jgi:hypothetical protein
MTKLDRFLHILHFPDIRNETDKRDENYDRLWKIQDVFEILNKAFSKLYNPSEHLTVHEFSIHFKRTVVFKQHIPK